jgi:transketolase
MKITQALTKAQTGSLTTVEVKTIIADSEGKKSDANKAKGHALQHVQQSATSRKTDYSEKRPWDEMKGAGSHSCFKTETQQADIVRQVLCAPEGQAALTRLNSGSKSEKVKSSIGAGETVVTQGSLGGEFGVFCLDQAATSVVVELHSSQQELHVRSAYPVI